MVYLDHYCALPVDMGDEVEYLQLEMIDQLSNKYLVKKLVVYLDDGQEAGMLLDLFEMIDQLSNKYLVKKLVVCLDDGQEAGMLLDLFEMIDQLSTKYSLRSWCVTSKLSLFVLIYDKMISYWPSTLWEIGDSQIRERCPEGVSRWAAMIDEMISYWTSTLWEIKFSRLLLGPGFFGRAPAKNIIKWSVIDQVLSEKLMPHGPAFVAVQR